MSINLSVELVKFSVARRSTANSSPEYEHIQAPNMFLIFKGKEIAGPQSPLHLTVVHGTKVLESLNVGQHIDAALSERRAGTAGLTQSIDTLPIYGMSSGARFAVRYRTVDGLLRDIQVKMVNITSCGQVAQLLLRRGLEFKDRPSTSFSNDSHHGAESRVGKVIDATTLPGLDPIDQSTHVPLQNPHSIQQHAFEARPLGTHNSPTGSQSLRQTRLSTQRNRQAFLGHSPSQPGQVVRSLPMTEHQRPTNLSHSDTNSEDRMRATEIRHETDSGSASIPPFSLLTARPQSSSTARSVRSSTSALEPPHHRLTAHTERWMSAGGLNNGRLHPQTSEPSDHRSPSAHSSSRPGTSSLTLPPLPRPTLMKDVSPVPAFERSSSGLPRPSEYPNASSSPLKRPHTALEDQQSFEDLQYQQTERSWPVDAEASKKRQSPGISQPSSAVPIAVPPSMNELLYGRRPLAEQSPNVVGNEARGRHNLRSGEKLKVPERSAPLVVPHAQDVSLAREHSPHDESPARRREPSTKAYATQSADDRQAALNDFILAQLDNPDFAVLCKDVESCWKRFALGL